MIINIKAKPLGFLAVELIRDGEVWKRLNLPPGESYQVEGLVPEGVSFNMCVKNAGHVPEELDAEGKLAKALQLLEQVRDEWPEWEEEA